MRPVRLEVKGFTCYREAQSIDFSRLGVFAIAGPTGSGKSSILDAITFALYGRIPRIGAQNLDEFISLGASRAAVTLEFEMKGERFRVVRSIPRKGTIKTQLDQITSGGSRGLANNSREVNEKVQALLGLEYEAFTQSVLLPQGEFARFLKSRPGDQQKVLRDLLRLGTYERMREKAGEKSKALRSQIEADNGRLQDSYAEATPENIKRRELEQRQLLGKKKVIVSELKSRQHEAERLRGLRVLTGEQEIKGKRAEELEREQPGIESLRDRISRAREAAAVIPKLEVLAAKDKVLQAVESRESELEGELRAAQAEEKACEKAREVAQQRALSLDQKRARVVQLTGVLSAFSEHSQWIKRCEGISENLAESRGRETSYRKKSDQFNAVVQDVEKKRDDLAAECTVLAYDVNAHTILKRAQLNALSLENARREAANLTQALHTTQGNKTLADETFEACSAEHLNAQTRHANAVQAAEHAMERLAAEQNRERAATLRGSLQMGCPCPVCGQQVAEVPSVPLPTNLQSAKEVLTRAEAERKAADERQRTTSERLIRAESGVKAAAKNLAECEAQTEKNARQIGELSAQVERALLPFTRPADTLPETFVAAELVRFDNLSQLDGQLRDRMKAAESGLQKAQSERALALQNLDSARADIARLTEEFAVAEQAISGYQRQIDAVGCPNPIDEKKAIEGEIASIEKTLQLRGQEYEESQNRARAAEQEHGKLQVEVANAQGERDQARNAAAHELTRFGFPDEGAARTVFLPETQIAEHEKRIRKFDDEFRTLSARLGELGALLKGVVISEADVAAASSAVEETGKAISEIDHRLGELGEQIDRLKRDLEAAVQLRERLHTNESKHKVVDQLARDLRSACFQQYLLEGSFKRLVFGASARLQELNERYELVFGDGKFAVRDHDNGGEVRSADTLSGGETFLVSLALAVELSEQVQQATGAVRLDSLFIDEGFGTLDSNALDTVADAIERLGSTNRMVGVITHAQELYRRLPRLEIKPSESGSRVQYQED